jgi:hypothetical protein
MKLIKKIIFFFQYILLLISFLIFKFIKCDDQKIVIGVTDIARNIYLIGSILKNRITVNFSKNEFYNDNYDYSLNIFKRQKKIIIFFFQIFYGPILLGYLANKAGVFFYIWSNSFLLDRNYEFNFLKSNKKKIVCFFVGDDIRSVKLTKNYAKKKKIDTPLSYRQESCYERLKTIILGSDEELKKNLAKSADQYADLIFNHPISNISYLRSKQHRWYYIYDNKLCHKNKKKFYKIKKIKIIHAPSDYLYKGTPLVRAAIKKLQLEGYSFSYKELNLVNNKTVIKHLRASHIVLNQFYDVAPGFFGIEAMANHCAVMMSAEPKLLISKTKVYNNTWMVTKYWQIYDNLKYFLKNPNKIKHYADKGYQFTSVNFTYENAREYLNKKLKDNNII